jgi:hypothetical protein
MADEREILWGPDRTTADYSTEVDQGDSDRAKLLQTADGNTILLEWDGANSQWVYGGPVDMGGEDISNIGTVTATAVNTTDGLTDPGGKQHTGKLADESDIPTLSVGGTTGINFGDGNTQTNSTGSPIMVYFEDSGTDGGNARVNGSIVLDWKTKFTGSFMVGDGDNYSIYYDTLDHAKRQKISLQ